MPPPGMQLDRAVTTTYPLDLVALLLVPITIAAVDARGDADDDGEPGQ